jgi:hypothetical protein
MLPSYIQRRLKNLYLLARLNSVTFTLTTNLAALPEDAPTTEIQKTLNENPDATLMYASQGPTAEESRTDL